MPVYRPRSLSVQYRRATNLLTRAHHGRDCKHKLIDYLKDPTRCCYCGHAPSKASRTSKHELERHLCSRHSVNIKAQGFKCPYCPKVCFALSNLNSHIDLHYAERDDVCNAVLRDQDDDSILIVCGFRSTSTNALERHQRSHETDNYFVKSVDSVKKRCHKVSYIKPEDRVPRPTKDDKPDVCPQFDIKPHFLKKALPSCFWPSAEYWEEKRKNALAASTSTTTPLQHPPISSDQDNVAPAVAPLDFSSTGDNGGPAISSDLQPSSSSSSSSSSFVGVHSGMGVSPHYFITDRDPTLAVPHVQPSALDYTPRVAHASSWNDRFYSRTTAAIDQAHSSPHSYSLSTPTTPYACMPASMDNGPSRTSSDHMNLFSSIPLATDHLSAEGLVALPPGPDPTFPALSSIAPSLPLQQPASDLVPVPAPEEFVFNAPLSTDAQLESLESNLPPLGPDFGSTMNAPYPTLTAPQPPTAEFIAPPAPEEPVVDASLFNTPYTATTFNLPIYDPNFHAALVRWIDELLNMYSSPPYENLTFSEFLEKVDLHIIQQFNQQCQQYVLQHQQHYNQPQYHWQQY